MSLSDDPQRQRYHFFILGLWAQPASQPGQPDAWRISLENSQTAERKGFADLADLEAFLHAWMGDGERR